jgi:hypothetical protein
VAAEAGPAARSRSPQGGFQTTRLAAADQAMFLLPRVEFKATRPNPFAVQRGGLGLREMPGETVSILRGTMMDAERPRLMTVRETADVLGCSTKSVYRLLDGGG